MHAGERVKATAEAKATIAARDLRGSQDFPLRDQGGLKISRVLARTRSRRATLFDRLLRMEEEEPVCAKIIGNLSQPKVASTWWSNYRDDGRCIESLRIAVKISDDDSRRVKNVRIGRDWKTVEFSSGNGETGRNARAASIFLWQIARSRARNTNNERARYIQITYL